MSETERERSRGEASGAAPPGRSSLFLSLALAAEHPCGPGGWPLNRPAFRLAALLDRMLADGWRFLGELEDLDDDQLQLGA